ncbi:tripartite tricarboxylate transporter TctB family protein [Octadecabacter sp. 1_MG-2023]|uniref:tripartite tricarboxylate transporter TctB family protein n=1 Tax=unclassified Octadecabacter TaxID=196158 RepID=UPI001C095AD8|nr:MULTISPECIES: tripartite tricarboxylate transporter TctB family protein [unclassified Octadecabacter]MBU2991711.1 tripartite tricarboxylate transporter TctB family protein [Octadecabacter sp. B2R22]MDO6735684.1 tripartite tricarboxylate transporter TctB family protein [Octadecabacter sp. 1_MG-2023]
MERKRLLFTPEILTLNALLLASTLSLIFMNSLVAEPKALFGRSLTAITPSLFPSIVLGLMAVMCVAALLMLRNRVTSLAAVGMNRMEWLRAVIFFGIMLLYGFTMEPFGFLISTAIALTLISLQMGSRSPIQIILVSLAGPVLLYLAATRLLAVALPELNTIELFYARLLS